MVGDNYGEITVLSIFNVQCFMNYFRTSSRLLICQLQFRY